MAGLKMREQGPRERVKNFDEVALGLTAREAVEEAKRCIQCKKASCVEGCPVEIDIPVFIDYVAKGEFEKALAKIREKNSLPAVCGRVCPQEDQCEKVCILAKSKGAVGIGALERFVADRSLTKVSQLASLPVSQFKLQNRQTGKPANSKVAVIGSGPAGVTCAGDLAKLGYDVTIFESLHKAGGVLTYGIPEFRLPKRIVDIELDYVKSLGVRIEVNFLVGKTKTIDELKKDGFKAFFIGIGAGLPYFLGVDGENLNGVYSANEFLTRTNLMKAYLFPEYDTPVKIGQKVGVIGAGNVAMDSARCARRLGAKEVCIIYRRTEEEMPARIDEIKRAKEEGVRFELLTNPTRFFGDETGWVKEAELLRNSLGEPDSSGRKRPLPIKGSEFRMKLDTVISAIGQGSNPLLPSTISGLKSTEDGNIITDDNLATSIEGVFAGGDIVTGAATVIEAMGAGVRAARVIDKYLKR